MTVKEKEAPKNMRIFYILGV